MVFSNNKFNTISMEFLSTISEWGYIGLFLIAFLAGSIAPFSSESVMALLIAANYNLWLCIVVATIGNWLGGVTCYYIGYLGKIEWIEKYLKIKHNKLIKMQQFLQGKGAYMALFVFVPIIGDLIIVAFGLMRADIYRVNIAMLIGKLLRYIVMAYGANYLIELFLAK